MTAPTTARAEYPTSRSLPDADATAPSVKGVIDGLVDAGIIDDDGPTHLHAVTYEAPRVVTGCTPAVVVQIDPVLSEEGT